eukprot:3525930-Pleurochrysis_carterae.AAC.1
MMHCSAQIHEVRQSRNIRNGTTNLVVIKGSAAWAKPLRLHKAGLVNTCRSAGKLSYLCTDNSNARLFCPVHVTTH